MKIWRHFPSFCLCCICLLTAILPAGCASNSPQIQPPTAQELDWGKQDDCTGPTAKKALQQQQQELRSQEQALKQLKTQQDKEKQDVEAKTWLAENKQQVEAQLTEMYRTNGQSMLEGYGFSGEFLDCVVDDAAIDGNSFIVFPSFGLEKMAMAVARVPE